MSYLQTNNLASFEFANISQSCRPNGRKFKTSKCIDRDDYKEIGGGYNIQVGVIICLEIGNER
jgi:hypothetical protein